RRIYTSSILQTLDIAQSARGCSLASSSLVRVHDSLQVYMTNNVQPKISPLKKTWWPKVWNMLVVYWCKWLLPSLAVCDLSNLAKPQDIIITEHLTILLAIVPKYSQKDWLSSYKTLTAYVVKIPLLSPEYALYTVTLFSRDADNFRTKARDRGFQGSLSLKQPLCFLMPIRDFEYNPETQESQKQELEKLMQDQETLRNSICNGAMQLWGAWLQVQCGDVELEKKIDEKIGQCIDRVGKHSSKKN
ncbi:V-type proton ATPase subunit C, partial [Camellia lanceoleosa]